MDCRVCSQASSRAFLPAEGGSVTAETPGLDTLADHTAAPIEYRSLGTARRRRPVAATGPITPIAGTWARTIGTAS
jgi:hypothetical protein